MAGQRCRVWYKCAASQKCRVGYQCGVGQKCRTGQKCWVGYKCRQGKSIGWGKSVGWGTSMGRGNTPHSVACYILVKYVAAWCSVLPCFRRAGTLLGRGGDISRPRTRSWRQRC